MCCDGRDTLTRVPRPAGRVTGEQSPPHKFQASDVDVPSKFSRILHPKIARSVQHTGFPSLNQEIVGLYTQKSRTVVLTELC